MTPVVLLSDGYIANGAEPWKIPDASKLTPIKIHHPSAEEVEKPFKPYQRDELLARPWVVPGTPELMHRVGGLEKEDQTGNISYDPENHQHMVNTRAKKVANIAELIGDQVVEGPATGELLVLSWGGTYGACTTAVREARNRGIAVSHVHLRWINPFPKNLKAILGNFDKVLIPEWNSGQLATLIRAKYLVDAVGYNKVKGKPFTVGELVEQIEKITGR